MCSQDPVKVVIATRKPFSSYFEEPFGSAEAI